MTGGGEIQSGGPGDRQPMLTTAGQRALGLWALGLLVDIIILNLWVEYSDSVVIDSFTISIFAAVVMRLLIGATLSLEHRVAALFDRLDPNAIVKLLKFLSAWAILFLSKFIILEVINIVFGIHVEIKGLLVFIAMVASLVIVEKVVLGYYARLGTPEQDAIPQD